MTFKHSGEPKAMAAGASSEQLNLLPAELAKRGYFALIPGTTYNACVELIDKLMQDGQADVRAVTFLQELRRSLIMDAKPYAPTGKKQPKPETPLVELVSKLPVGMRG